MFTTMSDNTGATPDFCPGNSGGVGSSRGQEAHETFLKGRGVYSESGKVSRGSPDMKWEGRARCRGLVNVCEFTHEHQDLGASLGR